MKEFKGYILLLLMAAILVAVYAWHDYNAQMAPAWNERARALAALEAKDHQNAIIESAKRRADFTETLKYGALLLLVASGVVVGVGAWSKVDQRQESRMRAVDGTFALQQFSSNGQVYLVDPNKALFGVQGFNKLTGDIITDAQMVGPERQLAYAMKIQDTRKTSAIQIADVRNTAQAKLMAGYYPERTIKQAESPQLPVHSDSDAMPSQWQPLALTDAFHQSEPFNWILGQNKQTGDVFSINPKQIAHFGIVGATGTGKTTYLGLLLMAYAMKNKYRVVVLDGKGGADWSKYKSVIEFHKVDYTSVGDYVEQMFQEYSKRQAVLNEYQVNSIWELPSGVKLPRPTMIMVDEFGSVMENLKAVNRKQYSAVSLQLGDLLRLSRGAGIYIVPCDQNPSKWTDTMRANLPENICFRLGGNIGNAINEYNLHTLDRTGHFRFGNVDYHAWPTYQVIDGLLADVDIKKPKALLVDGYSTGYKEEGEGSGQNLPPQPVTVTPVTAPVTDGYTRENEPVTAPVIETRPVLNGAPITAQDKKRVLNVYAVTGSKSETCRLVWGGKNGQRMQWLNNILRESEVLQ